jgi:hypothetical protein
MNLTGMIKELEIAFKDIVYEDKNHKYFYQPTNKPLISVTQFINKIKESFNSDFWAVYKAFQASGYTLKKDWVNPNTFYYSDPITEPTRFIVGFDSYEDLNLSVLPDFIKSKWLCDSFLGTERGSFLHNYLENLDRRELDLPKKPNLMTSYKSQNLSTEEIIDFYNSLDTISSLAIKFKKEFNDTWIPIAIEYVIGDTQLGIAGKFDRLYYNTKTNEYQIVDFKTDKKIEYANKYQKIKMFNVDDCEYQKYSIQTSLYKYIIEKNTDIKLGDSKIVWFDYRNNTYEIISTIDYTDKIKELKNGYDWSAYI